MRRSLIAGPLVLTIALTVVAGGAATTDSGEPMSTSSDQTFEERFPDLAPDAVDRWRRSIAVMEAEGVPVNPWLPVIESEAETRLPTTEKVAMRAVATLLVASKGAGLEQEYVDEYVEKYALTPWLSPDEARFLGEPEPSHQDSGVHSWRFEAAHVLFWSLSFIDDLAGPREQTDPGALQRLIRDGTRESLLANARLRSAAEVLDEADKIYRYRWALVDAQINGRPPPAGLNNDVAMEWHQALNWLIRHEVEPWDEISLDT